MIQSSKPLTLRPGLHLTYRHRPKIESNDLNKSQYS